MFSTLIFRRIDPRRRAVLQFKIHRMLSVSGASDVTCCVSGSAMSLMSVLAIGAWHKRPGCPSWGKRVKTLLLATSDLASQGKCVSVSCHWEKLSTLLRRMTYFYCWVKSGHNWEEAGGSKVSEQQQQWPPCQHLDTDSATRVSTLLWLFLFSNPV